jgi:UDP-N-acetylglucosamine--N-acetylmuramyl-(pentapeptide) pyrophosphoryl-undecaprenol N-acetylglucosamine transferase
MIETRKIIITGTHTTPAIELIHQLQNDRDIDWKIYYIGRRFNSSTEKVPSIESKIIPQNKVEFYGILCGKYDRRWLPNTISGIPQMLIGLKSAYGIIKKIKPHLVVSFGGYVSVPVIFSAWFQNIPSITHEQTHTLSLSTKINASFCRHVALSFPVSTFSDKYVITGNLLRREIFIPNSSYFEKRKFNLKKYPLIYVTAGNQGSQHLNSVLKTILPSLSENFTIVHQTGAKDFSTFNKLSSKFPNYYTKSYVDSKDIGWVFNNSKLIISRGGANTTQEIAVLKQKSIIIPLQVSQQNEQLKNSQWLQKKLPKITIIIKDSELTPKLLENSIKKLISKKNVSASYSPSPNLKLLKLIKKL